MPLRFFRRLRILPGVTLNISKRGASVSAGVRGAHLTINSRKEVTASTSLPGSGIGWRQKIKGLFK